MSNMPHHWDGCVSGASLTRPFRVHAIATITEVDGSNRDVHCDAGYFVGEENNDEDCPSPDLTNQVCCNLVAVRVATTTNLAATTKRTTKRRTKTKRKG
jgi:hypothetical protein